MGLDTVLDETTILNFRRLLETHGLAAQMLESVNAHLVRKGPSLRAGMIVDPRSTMRSRQTRNAEGTCRACRFRPPFI